MGTVYKSFVGQWFRDLTRAKGPVRSEALPVELSLEWLNRRLRSNRQAARRVIHAFSFVAESEIRETPNIRFDVSGNPRRRGLPTVA
jgi:hypothetical protein